MSNKVFCHQVPVLPRCGFRHVAIDQKKKSWSSRVVHTTVTNSPCPRRIATPVPATPSTSQVDASGHDQNHMMRNPYSLVWQGRSRDDQGTSLANLHKSQNDFLREQVAQMPVWLQDIVAQEGGSRMLCALDAVWSRQHGGASIALAGLLYCTACFCQRISTFHSIELKIGQDLF